MSSRRGYEFSESVRQKAIKKWHEENPGNEDVELDVHHLVSIKHARESGLHPHTVNTLQNAQAMPRSEHQKLDHSNTEDMDGFLAGMARFVGRLFD